jgi:hypothetical protein
MTFTIIHSLKWTETSNIKRSRVVAGADFHPNYVISGKSQTTTILGCGSAAGLDIPPFYVFAGKRLIPDFLKGAGNTNITMFFLAHSTISTAI